MVENDFLNQSPENFLIQEDFLAYNPEDFLLGEQQAIESTKQENSHLKTEVAIAVGIGVVFLVWVALAKRRLKQANPQSKDEAYAALKMVWGKTAPAWMQMATPAIAAAYQVGSNQLTLSDAKLAEIAKEYAFNLGHYMGATSDNAVIEGFSAQLNKNVNSSVAWERAVEGYGLDKQQMRSYILQSGAQQAEYQTESVSSGLKGIVQNLLHRRADKVAKHEAWASMTMGKNVIWMYQQEAGILPPDAMKEWITAEDERVCPICAPLDRQQVPISEKFETESGTFWVPGVHINCRCDIRIVLPEQIEKAIGSDLYDRDKKGRFAAVEERKYAPSAQTARLIEDVKEWLDKPSTNPPDTEEPYKSPLDTGKPKKSPLAGKKSILSGTSPLSHKPSPLANKPEYVSPLAHTSPLAHSNVLGNSAQPSQLSSAGGAGSPKGKKKKLKLKTPGKQGNYETPVSYMSLDINNLPIPEMWTMSEDVDYPSRQFDIVLDNSDLFNKGEPGALSDMYSPGISNPFTDALTRSLTNNRDLLWESADANFRLWDAELSGQVSQILDIQEETLNIQDRTVPKISVAADYVPTIVISKVIDNPSGIGSYKITHISNQDDRLLISHNIGKQGVKDYYLSQLRGDEIVWSDSDSLTADAYKSGPSIVKQFPELFVENPWTRYGSVSVWEITDPREHDSEDEYDPNDEDLENQDLDGLDIPLDPYDIY